jgi:acyl carrier protein
MKEELLRTLRCEVSKMMEIPEAEILPTGDLAALGVDSLQALRLFVLVERTYNLQLQEEIIKQFTSLARMVEVLLPLIAQTAEQQA